jgi:hypothetical protein
MEKDWRFHSAVESQKTIATEEEQQRCFAKTTRRTRKLPRGEEGGVVVVVERRRVVLDERWKKYPSMWLLMILPVFPLRCQKTNAVRKRIARM